ncbi:MAG TPA: hypothetical protein VK586_17770 [Streptosporangiaceae bacterium]|nr:hypothetical protein [Streptosporangiaceae bacterium]
MTRALVLGGGGPVGIAWESGLAVGLAAAGVAWRDADLIVGPGPEFLGISGWGANLMNPALSADAYQAGVRQAAAEAERLRSVWKA